VGGGEDELPCRGLRACTCPPRPPPHTHTATHRHRRPSCRRCYLAIMNYGGLENKHKKKLPNLIGGLEVLRGFTQEEQASGITTQFRVVGFSFHGHAVRAAPCRAYPPTCSHPQLLTLAPCARNTTAGTRPTTHWRRRPAPHVHPCRPAPSQSSSSSPRTHSRHPPRPSRRAQESDWYRVSLAVLRALRSRDTASYMALAHAAPYVLACVMALHFAGMRKQALVLASAAYGAPRPRHAPRMHACVQDRTGRPCTHAVRAFFSAWRAPTRGAQPLQQHALCGGPRSAQPRVLHTLAPHGAGP
jgi:hypothetical protein